MGKNIEPGCFAIIVKPGRFSGYKIIGKCVKVTNRYHKPVGQCIHCGGFDLPWEVEDCDKYVYCPCVLRRIDDYEPTVTDIADVKEYLEG